MLLPGGAVGERPGARAPPPRGLKRSPPTLSPASSHENLQQLHAACVVQRHLRRRWLRTRAVRDAHDEKVVPTNAAAPPTAAPATPASAVASARAALTPSTRASLLGAAALAALAAVGAAEAHQGALTAEVPTSCAGAYAPDGCAPAAPGTLETELDSVAAAEAAAAAEQALAASRAVGSGGGAGGALERAVLAVLLRYALSKLCSSVDDGAVSALLSADIGPFAASLTLGTLCGVLARAAAAPVHDALTRWNAGEEAPHAGAGPRLPPRPRRRHSAAQLLLRPVLSVGGLTRAFGLGAVQLATFDALRAGETAVSAALPQQAAGLLLAGAAAGTIAAAAAGPLDAGMAAARAAARASLRGTAADKRRMLAALDVLAFAALEAACAGMGLDPVLAL